jgi:hypothetical protein
MSNVYGKHKMAVEQIINHKKIKKFDVEDPNFKPLPKPEPEEVTGNILETDMYGEQTQHFYQPDNGNLQITELMTGLINKLDGLKDLNPNIVDKNRAIEVDIKREIAIGKLDTNAIKSEEIKGKVMNKKDKLKALRSRRK